MNWKRDMTRRRVKKRSGLMNFFPKNPNQLLNQHLLLALLLPQVTLIFCMYLIYTTSCCTQQWLIHNLLQIQVSPA